MICSSGNATFWGSKDRDDWSSSGGGGGNCSSIETKTYKVFYSQLHVVNNKDPYKANVDLQKIYKL